MPGIWPEDWLDEWSEEAQRIGQRRPEEVVGDGLKKWLEEGRRGAGGGPKEGRRRDEGGPKEWPK